MRTWLVQAAALGLALGACTDVTTPLIAAPVDSGIGARPPADAGRDGGTGSDAGDAGMSLPCGDHACECDNGSDDDGDGLVDGLDDECTGPLDDDESSFGTGHDDAVAQACQDCFWDENTDARDDGCAYPRTCTDPTATSENTLACTECSVSTRCQSQCVKRTPNGCDCFGCCTVTRNNGSTVDVLLQGAGCSLANVDDEQACKRCEPNRDCKKECGACELCLGRKRRDIARSCRGKPSDPEQTPICDEGETPCSATEPCGSLFYCHQGCCLVRVL